MTSDESEAIQKLIRRWKRHASKCMKASRDESISAIARERFFGEGNEIRMFANDLSKLVNSFGGQDD